MNRVNRIVHDYQWVHLFIGIVGNCLFITGSVLFLYEVKPLSIYLFIAGSLGMLIGSLGSAAVKLWKAKTERDEEERARSRGYGHRAQHA